ncbi:gliding motility-associated C-terminal domain-containing protein [Microvirga sp. STR05]|uniref:Gliding motility-associated C-terminal domain-containing protein n=1 Tax=Hymenobacter duratus TaxID=2771356 RepID=A0ABR8JHT2_9BACT|nr:gliding motility-associated C-terminal domain-containing protein [Hymenobacter duratus]MBD2715400.1 gliding motility-associated C-terminal domain-containing protein [Hymenobacter duratus]MBR7950307.1 gliding motility-associated C-terminal domain-containing protein [Microvirga sp. STR05]
MVLSLLSRLARRGPLLLLLAVLLSWASQVQATHLRAGDIQAKIDTTVGPGNNPRRVFFKMVLYQKTPVGGIPDEASVTIFFGDCGPPQVFSRASAVAVNSETQRNVYFFEHTYSAPSTYTVHYIGENRNAGVLNMSSSISQSFYISTTFTIDPGLGQNRSPILTKPSIDNAAVGQVFLHNPSAYDPDGDSLVFKLRPSMQVVGGITGPQPPCFVVDSTRVTGYVLPNRLVGANNGVQVAYTDPSGDSPNGIPGNASIFQQNRRTGTIIWNSPGTVGEYNVAFVVQEWRRTAFGRRLIGEVIRDMQINVKPTNNQRPILTIPPDICVVAGTLITGTVTATDADSNPIKLTANSGILPPATFVQNASGPPTATGTFRWTPDCSNIANQPVRVSFTAEDQPGGGNPTPLIDQRVWNITVIGPAPQNLRVAPGNTGVRSAVLTWNSYLCRKPGARILIFRKEGASTLNPGPCDTGIPAGSGFTQIGTLTYPSPLGTTDLLSFVDNGGGTGLERGKEYCYRIYVEFPLPAGGKSQVSQEACIDFAGRPLLMRNVTVDRTAPTNGQITVRWTKPVSTPPFADPQQYRVSRAVGQTTTGPFTTITTINNVNDTTYVDADPSLDTQNRSYSYRVELLSQNLVAETATAASSVRIDGTAVPAVSATALNGISLRWTYNVPWNNALRPTTVYRKGPAANDPFVAIATVTGTATGGSYLDEGTAAQRLVKGQTYCYYVSTNGAYTGTRLPSDLINLSQQQCIALRDVPCAPVLSLKRTNCDSLASRLFDLPATPISGAVYTNNLSWTLGNTPPDCSRAIASYNIYYAPNSQDSLRFLTSVPATQTTYQHLNLTSEAGCYAVQAVDSSGTRSVRSNIACKDDCQLFLLPNIFTPNGDGKNDTFRPKVFTPIRSTKFTVFNRWGVKIYESSADPLINWSGGGSRAEGGAAPSVVEGVYFYQAEVEFSNLDRTKRTYKGWVQITR